MRKTLLKNNTKTIMPEKKQKGIKKLHIPKMEETNLWHEATKDVTPIKKIAIFDDIFEINENLSPKIKNKPRFNNEINFTFNLKPPSTIKNDKSSQQMSATQKKKFENGLFTIDASLDLHGMTMAVAHNKLIEFIKINYQQNKRFLLVITGKGTANNISHGQGVLRRNLPLWLECPNISPFILAINIATPKHGGSGAFYIYLRKLL